MSFLWPLGLLLCKLLVSILAYEGEDLPPGPYCLQNGVSQCCEEREDQKCAHRILDTMCYCDEFCVRPDGHDDCCPDYKDVCAPANITDTTTTTTTTTSPPPTDGCSHCKDDSLKCSETKCIIDVDIITEVNNDESVGWRASDYTQFNDKRLYDGLTYKLGTKVKPSLYHWRAIQHDKDNLLEEEYDSRVHWPNYISPIRDQGWCGSDWAVSVASVVSDRCAIQSNGAENVQLSAQMLLSCNFASDGCKGGPIDSAWKFTQIFGLVEEKCSQYQANETKCNYNLRNDMRTDGCEPSVPEREERYSVSPVTRFNTEKDIMYEIVIFGPVQAIMTVFQDFFHYSGGIYRHSKYGDQRQKGYHSVKVIGWGVENGQKYWIVANSWGKVWGEEGYFRISRGNNECEIESLVMSAICNVVLSDE